MLALTVDVEEPESRIVPGTRRLLDMFEQHGARGTFFVVGEIAQRKPWLVREIADRGHEVGFHGHRHEPLAAVGESRLAGELAEWRVRLEDLAGAPVRGYRAPYFSLHRRSRWALPAIAAAGFRYDASVYPGLHNRHGWLGAPRAPVKIAATQLIVFPVPIVARLLPVAFSGGGYLALFPWALIRAGYGLNRCAGRPGMIYVHPWQVVKDEPASAAALRKPSLRDRILDALGRDEVTSRLARSMLAWEGQMGSMWETIASLDDIPEWKPE